MKVKILAILVVLAVLASSITACTPKDSYLVQVMKLAPEDTDSVTCMDVQEMMEDPDFSVIYDNIIFLLGFEMVGIDTSAISAFATFEIYWDPIFILIGDFNLEDIRDALIEEDFIEGEYRGVEIWTDYFEEGTVAFIGNTIVVGNTDSVEACIRIHKNEGSSMYDNEDMKAVADKLPAAIIHVVFGPDYMYEFEYLSGSICLSNEHRDDETLDISGWFKFDSKASAEATMEDIEDDMRIELDATSIDARLSGQFIEITAEMEIPDY